jgi:ribosomal protein L37AE/L43A
MEGFMDDEDDEMAGLTCPECDEWFQVLTNRFGLGLNYCPCCGAEWKGEKSVD